MQGPILFLSVLSILIVTHEWGHYITARLLKIRVERFSIGFGPILFRRKATHEDGTEFCVSLIPMGGYVKLAGESPESSTGAAWEFHTRSNFHKFLVVVAGPLVNAIVAFLIFAAIFVAGQPVVTTQVGQVMPDHAGHAAGLKAGDRIVSVNGVKVKYWEELLRELPKHRDGELWIDIERSGTGAAERLNLTPKLVKQKNMFGKEHTVPRIGILPSGEADIVRQSPLAAAGAAINKVIQLSAMIFASLGMVITGAVSFKDSMAGPIGIYVMTQEAAKIGWVYLFDFMGRLSVSLFVINLLPVPVLDGGHLLFIGIETITRRKLSDRVKEWGLKIGMVLVLTLTVFVIYQDFIKYEIVGNAFKAVQALLGRS
jgi:regulator of sigma E protease